MSKQRSRLISYASLMSTIGGGICWTGFGYQFAITFQSPLFLAALQMLAVIAQLMAPLLCLPLLRWIDRLLPTGLLNAISAALLLIVHICMRSLIGHQAPWLVSLCLLVYFLSLLVSGMFGMLIEPAYGRVADAEGGQSTMTSKFASFATLGILGKLVGMSAGPLLIQYIPSSAFLINAFTFAGATVLVRLGLKDITLDNLKVRISDPLLPFKNRESWKWISNPVFVETTIMGSSIFIAVLFMSTALSYQEPTAIQFSFYWFGATACALVTNLCLSRFKRAESFCAASDRRLGFVHSLPCALGILLPSAWAILICQWAFSLMNPMVSTASRARFYTNFGREADCAPIYALRTMISSLLILGFSLIPLLMRWERARLVIVILFCTLLICRWANSWRRVPATENADSNS